MKTVKRKAEVGERIVITNPSIGSDYVTGSKLTVCFVDEDSLEAKECDCEVLHNEYEVIIEDEIPAAELIDRDPILREVHQKIIQQTEKGLKKYGKPVHPDNHSLIEWIDHAVEESIDHITYLLMIKKGLEAVE